MLSLRSLLDLTPSKRSKYLNSCLFRLRKNKFLFYNYLELVAIIYILERLGHVSIKMHVVACATPSWKKQ